MQTSIEWLVKSLSDRMYIHCPDFGHTIIDKLVEQAKEMQKAEQENLYTEEQVREAINMCHQYIFGYNLIESKIIEIIKSLKKY